MSQDWSYTEEELKRYFDDPSSRRTGPDQPNPYKYSDSPEEPRRGLGGIFYRKIKNPQIAQAAYALSIVVSIMLLGLVSIVLFLATLGEDDLPSLQQLENPDLQLATVAYTADGQELARYAYENRSSVAYDDISPNVINALIATEDHRFHNHWGIDLFRFFCLRRKNGHGRCAGRLHDYHAACPEIYTTRKSGSNRR